jgi:membrane protein implicated in regulation of membrane protease activity
MNDISRGELIDEASNWAVGGGIVTMALFPLALPGIALLIAAAIPLVAVGLALALVAGAVVAPILLVRRLAAKVIGLRQRERAIGDVARVNPSRAPDTAALGTR